MTYLVNNCNHWISYHMIDALLNNGQKVEGLKNGEKNDHLLLYFGRNSNFSIAEDYKTKKYQRVISLNSPLSGIKAEHVLVINPDDHEKADGISYIKVPLLFGEWMPMNKQGMYVDETFISFDSESFLANAMYIKDFTKAMIEWIDSENKSLKQGEIAKKAENQRLRLESFIHLRDNDAVKKQIAQVIEHYTIYKEMYNCR
ncbi:hypothetical protein [Virgibacillus kimchii]